jgi:predicted enzyme related to lactoylglutathione lyase
MNPVSYFEIPVADMDRAIGFYAAVFGYAFERMSIDGNDMALFPHDEGDEGISGALVKGASHTPDGAGVRMYFTVSDVAATLVRAAAAGGRMLHPQVAVGDIAHIAEIEDSEGNCIALYAPLTAR